MFKAELFFVLLCITVLDTRAGEKVTVSNAQELMNVFAKPVNDVEVKLSPGDYHLSPWSIIDSTCGNCQDPQTLVNASVGLHIRGNNIRLTGPDDRSAIIYTHAGYGIFIDGCTEATIENIAITGGQRDTSGNATDAAIVVKNSRVSIQHNRIFDNIGDSAIVAKHIVGIMGICCRENSDVRIVGNDIVRNSWDGIALYRDAKAWIEGNLIDGVDKARGTQIGGGRGVGIGTTWNGNVTVKGNLVKRYWKGIGLFVDAQGTVTDNIVEDIITWGISLWDADKGKPSGVIENNVIYKTGACGASITRSKEGENPSKFVGNIVTETGQNPKYDSPDYYCYQCALALHAVPKSFLIEKNVFYNNRRATPDLPDYDISREDFLKSIQPACRQLSLNPIFKNSIFVLDFCLSGYNVQKVLLRYL